MEHGNSGKQPDMVLAAAVVLASILLSLAIVYSGMTVSSGLAGVASKLSSLPSGGTGTAPSGGTGGSGTAPSGDSGAGTAPAAGTLTYEQMKELLPQAAGTIGNKDAKVIIFEFSDYQCPFCRRHYNEVYPKIKENYIDTGKVLVAFFDYPLPFHPMAIPSAKAARCAGEQGKYWEAHDAIFNGQGTIGSTVQYTEEQLKGWILAVPGLDAGKFNACYSSTKYDQAIQDNLNLGSGMGVQGTPGFRINGREIAGAYPYETFDAAIKAALGS